MLLPAYHVASAAEPKQGGILKFYHRDSPGSASIHEGATYSVNIPFMPVYNNLIVYNQHVAQNSIESIVPDLAESWAWSGDNKTLTFKLKQGVKWHDGKPFTSADVKCTFDLLMGNANGRADYISTDMHVRWLPVISTLCILVCAWCGLGRLRSSSYSLSLVVKPVHACLCLVCLKARSLCANPGRFRIKSKEWGGTCLRRPIC